MDPLSPNALGSRLRNKYRSPIRTYLRRRRIDQARTLLLTTELPIKQVCSEIGYSDISNFSRDFRKEWGLSPAKYRKRERSSGRDG
jgi:AraC-like DNA-binding protein